MYVLIRIVVDEEKRTKTEVETANIHMKVRT